MIEVIGDTRACFIERDQQIKELNKITIDYWLKAMAGKRGLAAETYTTYIKYEVVDALSSIDKIKEVIKLSEHIWCQTYFIGQSAPLFYSILLWAKENNVRNKAMFDLAPRVAVKYNLLLEDRDTFGLMEELERANNISFVFGEDILRTIKSV